MQSGSLRECRRVSDASERDQLDDRWDEAIAARSHHASRHAAAKPIGVALPAGTRRSYGGSDASRVCIPVRRNVVDLTARDTDVQKFAIRQAVQFGTQPAALAPLLK
jgi:hypothetical protein